MEIILVARSIGARTARESLSFDSHAALVFNFGSDASPDYWVLQGGPRNGTLLGAFGPAGPRWQSAFGKGTGFIWDQPAVGMSVPIQEVRRFSSARIDRQRVQGLVDGLNRAAPRYDYNNGPNSNTYVRRILEQLGLQIPQNMAGVLLRGWNYR
jgi:hypothetical protein